MSLPWKYYHYCSITSHKANNNITYLWWFWSELVNISPGPVMPKLPYFTESIKTVQFYVFQTSHRIPPGYPDLHDYRLLVNVLPSSSLSTWRTLFQHCIWIGFLTFIKHFIMVLPNSPEEYVQETGSTGRDGLLSHAMEDLGNLSEREWENMVRTPANVRGKFYFRLCYSHEDMQPLMLWYLCWYIMWVW